MRTISISPRCIFVVVSSAQLERAGLMAAAQLFYYYYVSALALDWNDRQCWRRKSTSIKDGSWKLFKFNVDESKLCLPPLCNEEDVTQEAL